MPVYMVERDLNGISMDALGAAQQRAIETATSMRRDGIEIRYLRSTFVPENGHCMCLFQASDAETVAALNTSAALPYQHICEALDLPAP
jgi:hypothetical protein